MKRINFSFKKLNDFLTVVAVAIVFYILLAPLLPQISFWIKKGTQDVVRVDSNNTSPANAEEKEQIPKANTLVIPKMYLREEIHEGVYADTLSKGVWRRPHTSAPDIGGNTVLAGHRFMYSNQAVFYHLDKITVGDQVVIYWDGAKYEYHVVRIYEVDPTAVEIENDTNEPRLTIYTCTPLWTVQKRLVIQAALMEPKL